MTTTGTQAFFSASAREIAAYEFQDDADVWARETFGVDYYARETERYVDECDVEGGEPDPDDLLFDAWHERIMREWA